MSKSVDPDVDEFGREYPPQLLADMRNVNLGYEVAGAVGQALKAQLERDPGKFIDRLQRMEEKWMEKQAVKVDAPLVVEADEGSQRVIEVALEWLQARGKSDGIH